MPPVPVPPVEIPRAKSPDVLVPPKAKSPSENPFIAQSLELSCPALGLGANPVPVNPVKSIFSGELRDILAALAAVAVVINIVKLTRIWIILDKLPASCFSDED